MVGVDATVNRYPGPAEHRAVVAEAVAAMRAHLRRAQEERAARAEYKARLDAAMAVLRERMRTRQEERARLPPHVPLEERLYAEGMPRASHGISYGAQHPTTLWCTEAELKPIQDFLVRFRAEKPEHPLAKIRLEVKVGMGDANLAYLIG